MPDLKKGDRVRYVGHRVGCVSCAADVAAYWAKKAQFTVTDPSGLDDRDDFGRVDFWDERIGKVGTVIGAAQKTGVDPTITVHFDGEIGSAYAYISHLELA